MPSLCQQVKSDCEQLQAFKEEFFLAYETAKETGNLVKARVLKNRWEKKYDLLRKKLGEFLLGEVYDFIMELREETNEDIHDADDIHFQPDGTLAGRVLLTGVWYPFQGKKLIRTVDKIVIQNSDCIHTQPNGILAGRVLVGSKWYPFQGNELIETVDNEVFDDAYFIYTQSDGILAGRVSVGGIIYAFRGNKLIKHFDNEDNKAIKNFTNIRKARADNTSAGRVKVGEIMYPFRGNELIKTIDNEIIENCGSIHTQQDGTLAGRVQVGGEWRDFLWVNEEKYILF